MPLSRVVYVGECVINILGTVVVVVVVVVVVGLYADIHHESSITDVVVVVVVVGLYADIHHESFILMHRWGLMPWNVVRLGSVS